MDDFLPKYDDIRTAANCLSGNIVHTPMLESEKLNRLAGCRVLIKAESLQRTGSFKIRGAFNCISQLDELSRRRGIVAYSSGNHAQAVAAAAKSLETRATIVMPTDAPAIKINGTKYYGAKLRLIDRHQESREDIAHQIVKETRATLVQPYENFYVIAGQGTVGLEIADYCHQNKINPDFMIVPTGGGGLMAGCAIAVKEANPNMSLFTAEPEHYNDYAESLKLGIRTEINDANAFSLCDALLAPRPGKKTFAINQPLVTGGVAATDRAVLRAMAIAFDYLKLVIEPGGAVALAAILEGKLNLKDATVIVVASGGNVDPAIFRRAIEQAYVS